jgi:uncharacterized protein YbbC (DUF1343 family)
MSDWVKTAVWTCLLGGLRLLVLPEPLAGGLPHAEPASVGLHPGRLAAIDRLVTEALAQRRMPGCVVCIGRQGQIAWLKAYGARQLQPTVVPMTTDTVFDMASITKPVATATSVMLLSQRGRLSLSDKVSSFIPEFAVHDKQTITIRDLLIHQSGLLPDNPLQDYLDGPETALERICELTLQHPVGERFVYSDVNFILLGEIIGRVSGRTVHEFSRDEIFRPLGMQETGFLPSEELRRRAAPTEQRDGRWMQGEVHDPRAHELGGVAGHAGLFSTAEDLALYAQMMLGGGTLGETRILSPLTLQRMTRGDRVSSGIRGLGWDKWTGYSTNRGDLLSDAAFGHGGFTGTVLWIDPELDMFFLFLSNRVHPDGEGLVNPLAGKIATVVASALEPGSASRSTASTGGDVQTGLDVLEREHFRRLAGKRLGLITNHTGRSRRGDSAVTLLHDAEDVQLTALFSPEHGFAGTLDVALIDDAQDAATGLRIFSLYGETRRPTAEMLADVDTLVFDIQDIGTRFYTYISTMGEAMEAAAAHGKSFVVLDRPNPIGGRHVAGPMLDQGRESFVGFHSLPVRHGMTVGELALLFRSERKLELDLEVIRCTGWRERGAWDSTGLTWVNPSPNMRSLRAALLYPGIGLLETTNLSVGRGTDTPFEVLGAPWLAGDVLARALQSRNIPGVAFVPVEFTPDSSKFAGETCRGVSILITDRSMFEPVRTGIEVACQLRAHWPAVWDAEPLLRLLGHERTHRALLAGQSADEVWQVSLEGLNEFRQRRARFLLYE